MATHRHIYLIKDATGRTVMRVGHDDYAQVRRIADGWVVSLNAQQPGHTRNKVRNGRSLKR